MPLRIEIVAEEEEADGRSVEVRVEARGSTHEDLLEDFRTFAPGDREDILAFAARLLEEHSGVLPHRGLASCHRCGEVRNPEAERETRRPFVCRDCQLRAAAPRGKTSTDGSSAARLEVLFLGTGDAFGSGGKRPAAIFLKASGAKRGILLDAGPSVLPALRQEGLTSADLSAVVLSHFHGDHYGGFPFLELDAMRLRRSAPLLVLAPPGAAKRLAALRNCLYPTLPVRFEERIVEALPGERHPLPEETGGGEAEPLPARHQTDAWAFAWRLRVGRRTVLYSGDTEFSQQLIRAAAGVDLLIHECTGLKGLPGHTSAAELAAAEGRIRARRTLLVHLGADALRARDLPFERAHDGLRIVV